MLENNKINTSLWGKAVRDIAFDAMEAMKNNMGGMNGNANQDESGANESTLDEHLKRWHKGQHPTEPCQWMIKHGMGGEKKVENIGETGSTGNAETTGATGSNGFGDKFKELYRQKHDPNFKDDDGSGDGEQTSEPKFKGIKEGKIIKDGVELAPTFQDGGTKSKYRLARNKWVRELLNSDDGTFDLETGKPVEYDSGFQIAFQTTSSEDGNGMSDEEYDKTVEEISKITGSKPNLGNFEVPEISFHVNDRKTAIELMEKHNQHSLWNWKKFRILMNKKLDAKTNSVKQEPKKDSNGNNGTTGKAE